MNIFYWCVEYIAGFTEAFLCVVFCGIFIDREKLKKQRFKVFMLSIMMGMISILFTFFDLFSIYNSFAILVCFCVFLMIFYKKYIAGLLTCIFLMIVVAIDSISVSILSLSINTNYNELFEKFSYSRVICTMFSKSLLILIISFLSKFFDKSSRLSKKYTIIISIYSVLLLTINYFTFMINADIRSSETKFLLLPFFVISLITVLLLFYFALKISDYYEKNQELRLVRIRNKMLQSSLDETQQIFNLWKKVFMIIRIRLFY